MKPPSSDVIFITRRILGQGIHRISKVFCELLPCSGWQGRRIDNVPGTDIPIKWPVGIRSRNLEETVKVAGYTSFPKKMMRTTTHGQVFFFWGGALNNILMFHWFSIWRVKLREPTCFLGAFACVAPWRGTAPCRRGPSLWRLPDIGRPQRTPGSPESAPEKRQRYNEGWGDLGIMVGYYTWHTHLLIEGSLEVKLPTIWTDEKQSRAEAERRGRLEERRSEEKE